MNAQHVEIIKLLSKYEEGVPIETVLSSLKSAPSKRTLQRWLKELVDSHLVVRMGRGRSTRYASALSDQSKIQPSILKDSGGDDRYDAFIPLSEESMEIFSYVRQSVSARRPVGFSRDLIDGYIPGTTWYLDSTTRSHLKEISKTGFEERPAGTFGREIQDRLLIDLSWASSRLEGNTYSRLDTQRLIEFGQMANGRDATETQMILNHKRAVELLVDDAAHIDFNSFTFLNLHGTLSENLMPDPSTSGRLRVRDVEIGKSVYQPTNVPQVIGEVFDIILHKAQAINDPFEQALFVLVHVPYLQPFEDVNKRVARLGANISLIKQNLCPLTFLDVPKRAFIDAILGVYEMNRIELLRDVFVWAYERSTQQYLKVKGNLMEPDPTRLKYREQIHEIIRTVVTQLKIPATQVVKNYSFSNVQQDDQELFVEMVMDDLRRLHEGIIARYRIRPSEYKTWKDTRHGAKY